MARPATITDEQILKAARDVFLERGVGGTTAEVARRAGVAEGSIFKRFANKVELFRRAMDLDVLDPEFLRRLVDRVGQGDIRENLAAFAKDFLTFFRRLMPIIMMSWSARKAGLPHLLKGPNPPPVKALKRLTAFMEAEMQLGRLRRSDPEILARVFIGSVQNYVLFEVILKARDELPMSEDVFIRGLIHLVWTGAAPEAKS